MFQSLNIEGWERSLMKKKKERENIWLMIKRLNLVSMSCSLREESNEGGFTFKHAGKR